MNQSIIQNLCVGLYRKLPERKNQKKISHLFLFHTNEFGENTISTVINCTKNLVDEFFRTVYNS